MNKQTVFAFARMTPAEYADDCEQGRLTLDKPKRKQYAGRHSGQGDTPPGTPPDLNLETPRDTIRIVDCPSCRGSTFDDGVRPIVCHCGATVPDGGSA